MRGRPGGGELALAGRKRLLASVVAAGKALLAAILVAYLVRSGTLSLEGLRGLFLGAHRQAVALAVGLFFLSQAVAAERLRVLLRSVGIKTGLGFCFRLTNVGFVFNNVIPGTVGGDLVKIHCLLRLRTGDKGRASSGVLMDRIMGALVLIALSGASTLYLLARFGDDISSYGEGLRFTGVVGVCFVGAFLLLIFLARNSRSRAFFKAKLRAALPGGLAYDAAEGVGLIARDAPALAKAFVLSLVQQLIGLAGLLALARTAGAELPPIIDMAAVSLIVMLVSMVPLTPGNIGWAEFLAMLGWSAIGSNVGATVSLNWRILTTLSALPWGVLYLMGQGRIIRGEGEEI